MDKAHRNLRKLVEAHGLTMETTKRSHYHIRKDGAFICTVSHTGEQNALRQAVRQLVALGHLPQECKQIRL